MMQPPHSKHYLILSLSLLYYHFTRISTTNGFTTQSLFNTHTKSNIQYPYNTQNSMRTKSIQYKSTTKTQTSQVNDIYQILLYILSCLTLSLTICTYETFDCTTIKPKATTLSSLTGTRDLGFNYNNRVNSAYLESREMNDIKSYNEIMLFHRSTTIPSWKNVDKNFNFALGTMEQAILQTTTLKAMATEYQWQEMNELLHSSLYQDDLSEACIILKQISKQHDEVQNEIGFDWGSCAYRHCGALADAQEAIAELANSLGLYEPFECLFTIDVVERSLRDIYAVIPQEYKRNRDVSIPEYVLYTSSLEGASGVGEEEYDSIDVDLINALKNVRNNELTFELE